MFVFQYDKTREATNEDVPATYETCAMYNVFFKGYEVITDLPAVDKTGEVTAIGDDYICYNLDSWQTVEYKILGDELYMKEISAGVWDRGEVNKYKWNNRWQKIRALPETDNNTGKALERNKFL